MVVDGAAQNQGGTGGAGGAGGAATTATKPSTQFMSVGINDHEPRGPFVQTNPTMCPMDQVGGGGMVPSFRTQLEDVVNVVVGNCSGNVTRGGTTWRIEAGWSVVNVGGGRGWAEGNRQEKNDEDGHVAATRRSLALPQKVSEKLRLLSTEDVAP